MKLEYIDGKSVLNISCGDNIDDVIQTAYDYAIMFDVDIYFSFNGIDMICRNSQSVKEIKENWVNELSRRQKEYEDTPQYKSQQLQRRLSVALNQEKVDKLLIELPNIVSDESQLMHWLYLFAELADDVGIEFSTKKLSEKLKFAGWKKNDWVITDEMDEKDKTKVRLLLKHDRSSLAAYIVGQVIACLDNGMPPHPITCKFVDEYRRIAKGIQV